MNGAEISWRTFNPVAAEPVVRVASVFSSPFFVSFSVSLSNVQSQAFGFVCTFLSKHVGCEHIEIPETFIVAFLWLDKYLHMYHIELIAIVARLTTTYFGRVVITQSFISYNILFVVFLSTLFTQCFFCILPKGT